jgi:hypothetical protein
MIWLTSVQLTAAWAYMKVLDLQWVLRFLVRYQLEHGMPIQLGALEITLYSSYPLSYPLSFDLATQNLPNAAISLSSSFGCFAHEDHCT